VLTKPINARLVGNPEIGKGLVNGETGKVNSSYRLAVSGIDFGF